MNKADLVSPDHLGFLKATIHELNPNAKIIESTFSKVNPKEILNTNLFSFEEAEQTKGWIEELNKDEHTPETDEYGISSFTYRSHRPFDPLRFWEYLHHSFSRKIIRSKGLFWIASRPNQALIWNQAGGSLRADNAGLWWASMSNESRLSHPSYLENKDYIDDKWDDNFGDRLNELVIIGHDLDEELITNQLDAHLSTEEELSTEAWKQGYEDDWPVDRVSAAAY